MADLKTFIELATTEGLARVKIASGGRLPFCLLELRTLHPEGTPEDPQSIMNRTFGARGLFLDPETLAYGKDNNTGQDDAQAHLPQLYRLAMRPRAFDTANARKLTIWHSTKRTATAQLVETDFAEDALAVPLRPLGEQEEDVVSVTGLRLGEGSIRAQVLLRKTGQTLARYLNFDINGPSLLGVAAVDATPTGKMTADAWTWPVAVTPEGIEFDAILPDPTRFLAPDAPAASIIGRVRLEVSETPSNPAKPKAGKLLRGSHYRLRLIGPSEVLDADQSKDSLRAASNRLQGYFERLVDSKAPTRVRIDTRDDVPPLIWPLVETGTTSSRELVPWTVTPDTDEPRVEIDPDAIDIRLSTETSHAAATRGLARVNATRVQILGAAEAVAIDIRAGRTSDNPDALQLEFSKKQKEDWEPGLAGKLEDTPVHIDKPALRERLTRLYQDARLLDRESDEAPYAFLALRDGWLQLPLHATGEDASKPRDPADTTDSGQRARSALSGRIVFAIRNGDSAATRALSIEEAEGLAVTITSHWETEVTQIGLMPNGAVGQFLGFLFAADTSPSAREAVPTWLTGDAATREVPLIFGTSDPKSAAFALTPTGDAQAWSLSWSFDTSKEAPAMAWTAPDANPFITNYPMARTVPTAPVPALGRGLLPRQLTGIVVMRFEGRGDRGPLPENELPMLEGAKGQRLPGKPYQPPTLDDSKRPVQSLILPTLNGVEFLPEFSVGPRGTSYHVALRYDLPLLDELFARSDPPPPEPEDRPGPLVVSEGTNTDDAASEVTALYPDRMAKAWRKAEQRIRLTWTQDAIEDERIPVSTAGEGNADVSFGAIAQPFALNRNVTIHLDEKALFGRLSMDGQPESLAGAAVGLGGRVTHEDPSLVLRVQNGKLTKHVGNQGITEIPVTGYAADLYDSDTKGKPEGYLSDARGTAFQPRADQTGMTRRVQHRSGTGTGKKDFDRFRLLTLPEAQRISTGDLALGFHVRDLPVEFDGSTYHFTGIPLPGKSQKTGNPVESRKSFDGQAFNKEALAKSLYEWRCFTTERNHDDRRLGTYEIPVESFQFRPLRLADATFDKNGKLQTAAILGALSYRGTEDGADDDFAFGADRIYDRDDLFLMTLTPGSSDKVNWDGVQVVPGVGSDIALAERDRSLRIERRLERAEEGLLQSRSAVEVNLTLTFKKDNLRDILARLQATLFGRATTLVSEEVTAGFDALRIAFELPNNPASDALALLQHVTLAVALTPDGSGDRLAVDGELIMRGLPDPHSGNQAVLLKVTSATLTWLDLSAPVKPPATRLTLDHNSGVLTLVVDGVAAGPGGAIFDLAPADGKPQRIHGSFSGVFGHESGLTLNTGHLLLDARSDGGANTIVHQVLFDPAHLKDGTAKNELVISWTTGQVRSPIRWPVGKEEVALTDGGDGLDKIATGRLDPRQTGAPAAGRQSRILSLGTGGDALEHRYRLVLNRHKIDTANLVQSADGLRPRQPIRMLAAVEHQLSGPKPDGAGNLTRVWWSLDHVTFTTAPLIVAEAEALAQVPRHSRRRRTQPPTLNNTLTYRGDEVVDDLPQGVARIGQANMTGWHDAGMQAFVWSEKALAGRVLVLGAAPLWLPHGTGEHAQIAMLPWAIGFEGKGPIFQTGSTATAWRTTTADVWAAHAMAASSEAQVTGLNTGMTAELLDDRASEGGLGKSPGSMIPVEAGFFEVWKNDTAGPIDRAALHRDAPYFLRTALALRARWRADSGSWTALTIVPRPSVDAIGHLDAITPDDPALRFISLHEATRESAGAQLSALPADLIALSDTQVKLVQGYRLVEASSLKATSTMTVGQDNEPPAEIALVEAARLALPEARVAARVIRPQKGAPKTLVHPIDEVPDPLAESGAALTSDDADLGVSPALGWPIEPTEAGAGSLPIPAPALCADMALQSPEAGFAGRTQRTQWPAAAPAAQDPIEALFSSHGQHVIFDRGKAPFAFDGPSARHLTPAPTRRRAPETRLRDAVLPVDHTAPVTAPTLDRTVIGRRPGMMDVTTTSMTMLSHHGSATTTLDAAWPGMGQPADIGPLVAHQVRMPRSPILPADPLLKDIELRRRTYLSRADREDEVLAAFGQLRGSQDVIRLTGVPGPGFSLADSGGAVTATGDWRITLEGHAKQNEIEDIAKGIRLHPDWSGHMTLLVTGVFAHDGEATGEPGIGALPWLGVHDQDARDDVQADLRIGPQIFAATTLTARNEDRLLLSFAGLTEAREALQAATPDTPMSLTVNFLKAGAASDLGDTFLREADVIEMTLPVKLDPGQRRVVATHAETIVFGDPSYDRALASQALTDAKRIGGKPHRLSIDRQEYNADSSLYLALGEIDEATDAFNMSGASTGGIVKFQRIPPDQDGVSATPQDLVIYSAGGPGEPREKVQLLRAFRLNIGDLRDPVTGQAPLAAGDTLAIRVAIDGAGSELSVRPRIVAAPVIAPPPSVFAVTETVKEIAGREVARLRLHAVSALPTRIEFHDLLGDLGRGHVRRKGLFIWPFARPNADVQNPWDAPQIDLLKLDRSGGAQLPDDG